MSQILIRLDSIAPFITLLLLLPKYMKYEKSVQRKLRFIILFLIIQFVLNFGATLVEVFIVNFDIVLMSNNYILHALNTILSFIVIIILLSHILQVISKKAGNILMVVFLILFIVSAILGDGIHSFNSYSAAFASLTIIFLCFLFFYQVLKGTNKKNTETPDTPLFWCVSGIFTYYFGSFFIFLTYQYLISSSYRGLSFLWSLHNILLLICCLYMIWGIIWKNYQQTY
ncbi:MAG: hypothetical protein E6Q95_05260 [Chitinophagaceae bacterium]|nr:MAG: hypothetical protein E6Q95_05260 [Chitinophagaceae bacterium]